MAKIRRPTIPSANKDMELKELSYTVGGNIKWYNQFGKLVVFVCLVLFVN